MQARFVAELLRRRRGPVARDLFSDGEPIRVTMGPQSAPDGSIVEVRHTKRGAVVDSVLARRGSPIAGLYGICAAHQLNPYYPAEVEQEVERLLKRPGIRDRSLVDLSAMPFVTIDGPGTRDLDQAVFVEPRRGGAHTVHYALADASHPVRAGTALFEEALRRGASYYLPGLAVPMLPRPLSEGITSLGPRALRRALVLSMHVDKRGIVTRTRLARARIRSRAQLTFDGVEDFLFQGKGRMPDGVAESLAGLRRVGELRLADARRRDVVSYRRSEVEFKMGREGLRFMVGSGVRSRVERYNEQVSLMCNIEGALFLKRNARGVDMQPIFRVHPAPDRNRYAKFEALLGALCREHKLNKKVWRWKHGQQSLADFLRELPSTGREGHIASAVHRQAVMLNFRSTFSEQAASHFGVGAEVYARFSAPMREIVGVFVHKEAVERLEPATIATHNGLSDDQLREQVVQRGNDSRALQKLITKEANRLVLDHMFSADTKRSLQDRPVRTGTIMGLQPSKAHVLLHDPPVEVKVYARYAERRLRTRVTCSDDGVLWKRSDGRRGGIICRLGDEVRVRVQDRDNRGDRWMLVLDR